MDNLKLNTRFEDFISKLPYNKNNSSNGLGVFVVHANEEVISTRTAMSRTKITLDKTAEEIMANIGKVPIVIINNTAKSNVRIEYVGSAVLDIAHHQLVISYIPNGLSTYDIDENGYPFKEG